MIGVLGDFVSILLNVDRESDLPNLPSTYTFKNDGLTES